MMSINKANWHHPVCGSNTVDDDVFTMVWPVICITDNKPYIVINTSKDSFPDGVHLSIGDAETFAECLRFAINKAKHLTNGDQ
jgi:hypothetical protein